MNQPNTQKGCCCISYEMGVTPCLCQCHTPPESKGEDTHKEDIEEIVEEIENILYGMNINIDQGEYRRVFAELKLRLPPTLTSYGNKCREDERERCIDVVRQSRTLGEELGVGKNQDEARTQAIIDLQTNKTP